MQYKEHRAYRERYNLEKQFRTIATLAATSWNP